MHSLIQSFETSVTFPVVINGETTEIVRVITYTREPDGSFKTDLGDYWSLNPELASAVTRQIKKLNEDLEEHFHSLI